MTVIQTDRGKAWHVRLRVASGKRSHHLPQPATTVHNAASNINHEGELPMADRVAVITGAGSGIGRASALALMADGWSVALAGRRKDALEETAGMAKGGKSLVVPTDVTDPAQVAALFAQVKSNFGRLDMLFNNAGGNAPTHEFRRLHLRDVARVCAVNLNAMFLCANAAFRMMRDQAPQGGRIINNGSISAHVAAPGSVAYTSTKHAVTGLTKSIALDGRQYDICCSQIDIGNAATPMTARSTNGQMQPLRPDGGRAADGRGPCRPAGGVHGEPAAGIERAVRDDHGDEDAVYRTGVTVDTPLPLRGRGVLTPRSASDAPRQRPGPGVHRQARQAAQQSAAPWREPARSARSPPNVRTSELISFNPSISPTCSARSPSMKLPSNSTASSPFKTTAAPCPYPILEPHV